MQCPTALEIGPIIYFYSFVMFVFSMAYHNIPVVLTTVCGVHNENDNKIDKSYENIFFDFELAFLLSAELISVNTKNIFFLSPLKHVGTSYTF